MGNDYNHHHRDAFQGNTPSAAAGFGYAPSSSYSSTGCIARGMGLVGRMMPDGVLLRWR